MASKPTGEHGAQGSDEQQRHAGTGLQGLAHAIGQRLPHAFGGTMGEKRGADKARDEANAAAEGARHHAGEAAGGAQEHGQQMAGKVWDETKSGADAVRHHGGEAASGAWEEAQHTAGQMRDDFYSTADAGKQQMQDAAGRAGDQAQQGAGQVRDFIQEAADTVRSYLPTALGGFTEHHGGDKVQPHIYEPAREAKRQGHPAATGAYERTQHAADEAGDPLHDAAEVVRRHLPTALGGEEVPGADRVREEAQKAAEAVKYFGAEAREQAERAAHAVKYHSDEAASAARLQVQQTLGQVERELKGFGSSTPEDVSAATGMPSMPSREQPEDKVKSIIKEAVMRAGGPDILQGTDKAER